MLDTSADALAGLELVDRRGERIGRVRQVYAEGGHPGWVAVRGNLFGTAEVLVPLDGAVLDEDVIGLPVSRERVRTAPRRDPDVALAPGEAERLRTFYSEPVAEPAAEAVVEDQADVATMTRSEERLHVVTEQVPRTRVRLVKVVVTEEQAVTVPLRREEVRLVREPIEDAAPGGTIGEDRTELVLHEDRLVVTTEVVAVERIRLVRDDVVEQRTVTQPVRRERIDLVDAEPEAAAPAPAPAPIVDEATPATAPRAAAKPRARKSPTSA